MCTWVQQQVTSDQIFDGHVGTQFDALQVAVCSVQVDRKHILQVHRQACPADTHWGRAHQTLNTESHVAYNCLNYNYNYLQDTFKVRQPGGRIES